MNTSIGELNLLTDSEKHYRCNERLAEWHARNNDWGAVLRDKWALLKFTGGN